MFTESKPTIRRIFRFIALPYCFFYLIDWNECKISKFRVIKDLLYIFFNLKYFPDNYGACRLWEINKTEWPFYYGSTYNSYPRIKLRKEVQTYERQIIFNDKLITVQFLKGYKIPMPATYGVINPYEDFKMELLKIFNETGDHKLIIKPILGHAGLGITIATKINNAIKIFGKDVDTDIDNFSIKEPSIVQQVVLQSEKIAKISSSSVNTIRVVTLYTKLKEVLVISSTMRFGVEKAVVDNWSAGGIAVGVDHNTGRLKKTAYDKKGNRYLSHPISGEIFENFQIPYWNEVLDIAINVQKIFLFYKLIGVDVAITEDGPILIEVNANPDIIFQEQTSGPILKDMRVLKEFSDYDLLYNDYQKRLLNG